MNISELLTEIKQEYKNHRNKENALAMKAYLKGKFSFFGIKKPLRNELLKPFLPALKNIPHSDQEAAVRWLWKQQERELHYLAFEILFRNRKFWNENILDLFEEMIITQSWWDTVDYIASTLLGYYFTKWPKRKVGKALQWSKNENLWLNRTAIIFQLKYGEKTDVDLLFKVMIPHLASTEFFHQKAIGWALRQYGYTDLKAVKRFVATHDLKPLSKREALKHA
ncbi:MAG TPA: DNA alkylation repair protein [Bacteroidia bacterium]|nr:DNA alkylation repair protein [Bacteroidia bacterium]